MVAKNIDSRTACGRDACLRCGYPDCETMQGENDMSRIDNLSKWWPIVSLILLGLCLIFIHFTTGCKSSHIDDIKDKIEAESGEAWDRLIDKHDEPDTPSEPIPEQP